MDIIEPRTNLDIIRDLLSFVENNQWQEREVGCGRGCCSKWKTLCPECDQEEEKGHGEGCRVAKLIKEAEAFIIVEEELVTGASGYGG